MRNIALILLLGILTLNSTAGNDKNEKKNRRTVVTRVTDIYGEPIAGASVHIAELGETYYSDLDGNIRIQIPAEKDLPLSVSYLGYKQLEVRSSSISGFSELTLSAL